jgi:hypothetical protein
MQSLLLAFMIAAGTLNPIPVPSEPCRTVSTPHGDMCVTEVLKIYGDAIRTEYETDAKRICHGRGGNELLATENDREWLCVRRVSVG